MRKRILELIIIVSAFIVFSAIAAMPVLAYAFRAQVSIQETAGNSYDMLGANWTQRNTWLANNGYMNSTANDTRVQTLGGIDKPHMVADNKTLVAVPVGAYSQNNLYFVTGEAEQENMYVIPGYGGYVTTLDNAAVELGDNFTASISGWIDTDNGTDKYLLNKEDAFGVAGCSGNITAYIHNSTSVLESYSVQDGQGSAYGANTWLAQTFTLDSESVITSVSFYSKRLGTPGVCDILITALDATDNYTPDDGTVYATGSQDIDGWGTAAFAWNTITVTDTMLPAGRYAVIVKALDGVDGVDTFIWGLDTAAGYADGCYSRTTDGGTTWTNFDLDLDFRINTPTPQVSASGISSGEHDIVVSQAPALDLVKANSDKWTEATSDDKWSWTDGAGNDVPGSVSFKVKLDDATSQGLFSKYAGSTPNREYLFQTTAADLLFVKFFKPSDAGTYIACTSDVALTAYQGEYITLGMTYDGSELSSGFTFYINGQAIACTPSSAGTYEGTADGAAAFTFGYDQTNYFDASVYDFRWYYNDELTATEMMAVHNNASTLTPTYHYWMNEGAGNTLYDSGSEGINATNSGGDWIDGAFNLYVDDVLEDSAAGADVPDNANSYQFMYNATTDFMPYAEYIKLAVDGTQVAWYQPNSIIETTVLPNRVNPGTNDGAFTWGGNPAGISVTLGSMESAGQSASIDTSTDPTSDILPVVGGSDWNEMPDTTGTLMANPFYPVVKFLGDTTTLSQMQWWRIGGIVLCAMTLVLVGSRVRGHHLITGIMTGGMIGLMVQQTIFPIWSLVFSVLLVLGGLISERARQL